ncbi:MAG: hypothetical protein ACK5N8_03175 [Alphaproteobacteria bacterium]
MKNYLIILFFAFTTIVYAQKSTVIFHSATSGKVSNAKKVETYYHSSKLNLGIDLDLESWRDSYLRNYKVVVGYGKYNMSNILLAPYLSLGYRTMGNEFFSRNMSNNLKCNNYYSGVGLVFSKKRNDFLYALKSEISCYSHKVENRDFYSYKSNNLDYNFSLYVGYILSKHILLYGQVEYNHRDFTLLRNSRKFSSRVGVAYKIQAL